MMTQNTIRATVNRFASCFSQESRPCVVGNWLLAALILSAGPVLSGQDEDEDVYELSPFEVRTEDDRGYLATNTTAGTSLNILIRDLPMSLEVVTRELIEDLGATDMREALSYSAGVFTETFENTALRDTTFRSQERSPSTSVNVGDPFNLSVSIRGYSVPNQQRMGFRVGASVPAYGLVLGGSTDTSNTARQEVVRGPQSLLYGINVLSGVINIVPRRPLAERRTIVSLTAGSYDLFRATLDHTGPLVKDKLNFRVMHTYDRRGDETQYNEFERKYYVGQLEWFPMRRARLFVEAQYLDQVRKGGGPQFFRDSGTSIPKFENKYGERYTFGRDYFDEEIIDDEDYIDHTDEFGDMFGRNWLIRQTDREYEFPDLGQRRRVSGPDVRRWDEELNLLALAQFEPTDNLAFEVGTYYTKTDIRERNVHMQVSQTAGPFIPGEFGGQGYKYNPELRPYWDLEADAPVDPENWGIGWGPGELWVRDHETESAPVTQRQRKYAWYSWYDRPTKSESWQSRVRAAYTFETSGLDGWLDADHTFTGGINYIRDKVSFVSGTVQEQAIVSLAPSQLGFEHSRLDQDPFYVRPTVFDYSDIRLEEDTVIALPGGIRYGGLGDLSEGASSVARSGWIDADLWHKGKYGLYHGEFFNKRLNLILGVRQDAYQVRESEHLRIIDRDAVSDNWTGASTRRTVPGFIGYGNEPYQWRSDLPDSLNESVERDIGILMESTEGRGTVDKNFPRDEKFVTKSFGGNYRFSEALSGYYLYSEGIFPNTGLRDGSHRPIEAEQTKSNEIGMKYDLFNGRISGSFGIFRIERENAVWNWFFAPAPAKWAGGPNSPHERTAFDSTFSPLAVREDEIRRNYGVRHEYVEEAFRQLGLGELEKQRGQFVSWPYEHLGLSTINSRETTNPMDPAYPDRRFYFWIDVDEMDDSEGPNPFELALDLAVADREAVNPFEYQVGQSYRQMGYNASIDVVRTANVRFEEVGEGIDGQTIFSLTPNYQIIFNYSYQKRRVSGSGFILEPGYELDQDGNPVDDTLFTTRWDRWVWILGPENFEDPANPATLKDGAIKGVDLSFVPRWAFRIWNKYQFSEGMLEGLEIAGGVRGNGPTPTQINIGGANLSINRTPTPDIPALFFADAMIAYRFSTERTFWRVSLNVNNLFDKRETVRTAEYPFEDADSIFRRTRVHHRRRTFRLSLSAQF